MDTDCCTNRVKEQVTQDTLDIDTGDTNTQTRRGSRPRLTD